MVKKEAKQIILCRKDLGMSRGKMSAQVAHASLACILNEAKRSESIERIAGEKNGITIKELKLKFSETSSMNSWINGKFIKIVLVVDNEKELLEIYNKAKEKNLNVSLITDAGLTEFDKPTKTCVGIGPYFSDKFKGLTDHLKIFR